MVILRDDLTKRESRAEAGNALGEADSAATATKTLFSRPGSGRGKGRAPRPTSPLPPARSPPPAWPGCHCVSPESPVSPVSVPESSLKGVGAAAPENGAALAWSCPHVPRSGWEWRKRSHRRSRHPPGEEGHSYLDCSGLGVGDLGAPERDTAGAGAQEDQQRTTFVFVSFCLSPRTWTGHDS